MGSSFTATQLRAGLLGRYSPYTALKAPKSAMSAKKQVVFTTRSRPLPAALSTAVFEGVNLIYVYLSGVALDGGHFGRALVCVLYTAAIAAVIQFPIRWWLGVYKLAKAR